MVLFSKHLSFRRVFYAPFVSVVWHKTRIEAQNANMRFLFMCFFVLGLANPLTKEKLLKVCLKDILSRLETFEIEFYQSKYKSRWNQFAVFPWHLGSTFSLQSIKCQISAMRRHKWPYAKTGSDLIESGLLYNKKWINSTRRTVFKVTFLSDSFVEFFLENDAR